MLREESKAMLKESREEETNFNEPGRKRNDLHFYFMFTVRFPVAVPLEIVTVTKYILVLNAILSNYLLNCDVFQLITKHR